jgi:hypothetical protein
MENSYKIGVKIPTNEEPQQYVVATDTGSFPTVEFQPGSGETRERAAHRLTHRVLSKTVGIDAYNGTLDDGTLLFTSKPVDPTVPLNEGYTFMPLSDEGRS